MTQDSILIYECLLSAFDLSLKCNFVRQIVSSFDLSDTSVALELPGRTFTQQDNEVNTSRTDLVLQIGSDKLLHFKIDRTSELDYLATQPRLIEFDASARIMCMLRHSRQVYTVLLASAKDSLDVLKFDIYEVAAIDKQQYSLPE